MGQVPGRKQRAYSKGGFEFHKDRIQTVYKTKGNQQGILWNHTGEVGVFTMHSPAGQAVIGTLYLLLLWARAAQQHMWPLTEKRSPCQLCPGRESLKGQYILSLSPPALSPACYWWDPTKSQRASSHLKKSKWIRQRWIEKMRSGPGGANGECPKQAFFFLDPTLRDLFTWLYTAGFCLFSLLYSALLWDYLLTHPLYC